MSQWASVERLFTPFTLGQLALKNRIVMAPMTRKCSPNGVPGPDVAAYYARRARHDVGLIITEGIVIDHPASADHDHVPRLFGADAIDAWRNVVAAVHEAGGRIAAQLWHVGMMRRPGQPPNPDVPPVGPSGLVRRGQQTGVAMVEAEIARVVAAYAAAAQTAQHIGFDAVELHGAHGYLIDQFLWQETNARSDDYGGDIVGRTRFAVEIVQACRRLVGEPYPILLRLSQWKLQDYRAKLAGTPRELDLLLGPLTAVGVDAFHCSTRCLLTPEFEGSDLNLAAWAKKLTGRPVIAVGSVGQEGDFLTGAFAEHHGSTHRVVAAAKMVDEDRVDLIAVGRALLADPEWAIKIRGQRLDEIRPFTRNALATLE